MSRDGAQSGPEGASAPRRRMPLPGVAAIAFYLLLVSGTLAVGFAGGHYPALMLIFSVLFLSASAGLISSFRWAWALALGAVFLLAAYNAWSFSAQRSIPPAVQGLLNLVFFLYLIRPEVRAGLR